MRTVSNDFFTVSAVDMSPIARLGLLRTQASRLSLRSTIAAAAVLGLGSSALNISGASGASGGDGIAVFDTAAGGDINVTTGAVTALTQISPFCSDFRDDVNHRTL